MSYSDIVSDIATRMETIPSIGIVHDYYRYTADAAKFLQLFKCSIGGKEQIRGWEITRISAPEARTGAYFRYHKFRITGYLGLCDADATDKTFQTLIDDVCELFRTAEPPGGSSWYYLDLALPGDLPAQAVVIEPRMFGSVLCHYAEILLTVTERILP